MPAVIDEANCLVAAAVIVELGGDDLAVLDKFTVLPDLFVLDVVVVAGANIEDEIDIPGENAGDVHDDAVGKAGGCGALEQRRFDAAVGEPFALLDRPLDDLRRESRLPAFDLQRTRQVKIRVHADEVTLVMRDEKLVTWLESPEPLARLVESGYRGEVSEVEVVLPEQLVERVAATNRKVEFLVRRWVDRVGQDERYFCKNELDGFIDRIFRAGRCRHDRLLRWWRTRRRRIQCGDERKTGERYSQTHDKPLQGFGFFRFFLCSWLVVVQ